MTRPHETAKATADSGLTPDLRARGPSVRRRVMCGGVRGIFARRDGRWVLENESELSVLVGLGDC